MGTRLKIALLMGVAAAAVYTGAEAYRTIRPAEEDDLPRELYASYEAKADIAQFFLKDSGGYVAIYDKARGHTPLAVTDIELDCLRKADKAMVRAGLPVADRWELLQLLEDLGS